MRYAKDHKAKTREKIVANASKSLRAMGLAGVSLPALMRGAGLTHGGFYSHFKNRDQLIAEAVLVAAQETAQQVFEATHSLVDLKARYLSQEHAQHPDLGCVVAALASEGARQSEVVRQAFSQAAVGLLKMVNDKCSGQGGEMVLSDEALRVTSMLVGSMVLARSVGDKALASRILAACQGQ